MFLIQNVTANPTQTQSLILTDGSSVGLTINYAPQQYAWFIVSLSYGSFLLQGLQITANPNMLQQWRNEIPFGLACFVQNNREPSQQQDFQSGAAQLFILSAAEVVEYTAFLSNGVTAS